MRITATSAKMATVTRMQAAIHEVEQAVAVASHEMSVGTLLEPVPARSIDRRVAGVAPRFVPSDLVDLLLAGGRTPFWSEDPEALIDDMIRTVQSAPSEFDIPSPRLIVGRVDRDVYVVGEVADPSVQAPVAMWSTNALFTIPVAPSLPALFRGFAACVQLWDSSAVADDEDGGLLIGAWWEALWALHSSSGDPVIPGAAEALLRIYRAEVEEWPNELPTWEGLEGPKGWWADLLDVYRAS